MSPTQEITMLDPRVRFANTSIDMTYIGILGMEQVLRRLTNSQFRREGCMRFSSRQSITCEDVAIFEIRVNPETHLHSNAFRITMV